jgi:hypothetical protein
MGGIPPLAQRDGKLLVMWPAVLLGWRPSVVDLHPDVPLTSLAAPGVPGDPTSTVPRSAAGLEGGAHGLGVGGRSPERLSVQVPAAARGRERPVARRGAKRQKQLQRRNQGQDHRLPATHPAVLNPRWSGFTDHEDEPDEQACA